jgi:hypothetical protein
LAVRTDYSTLARTSRREQFVANCPFPFLLARRPFEEPEGPAPTIAVGLADIASRRKPRGDETGAIHTARSDGPPTAPARLDVPILLAVCKTQDTFPRMITVGRTNNNDLVVNHVTVSRFHAWFREVGDTRTYELLDAGSRNGTWAQDRRVAARAAASPVAVGDTVRFGTVEFQLVDAGAAWDLLTRRPPER